MRSQLFARAVRESSGVFAAGFACAGAAGFCCAGASAVAGCAGFGAGCFPSIQLKSTDAGAAASAESAAAMSDETSAEAARFSCRSRTIGAVPPSSGVVADVEISPR